MSAVEAKFRPHFLDGYCAHQISCWLESSCCLVYLKGHLSVLCGNKMDTTHMTKYAPLELTEFIDIHLVAIFVCVCV